MSKPFLLAAVAAASLVSFGFQPVTNNASFTRDGVTYVQRGGLKNSDFVATNVDASAVSRVTSVNSKTGAVHLAYSDVGALPATTSHLPGDVPTNRTVNAKSLDANVTLDASDVSALPDDYVKLTNSATFKSAVETVSPPVELPAKWALANVTNASGGTVTAGDVNALPSSTTHLSGDVPTTRTVNEYPLSSDITLDASDVGALSTSDGGSVNGDVDVTGALTAASFATDGEVYMNGSTYIAEAQIDSVTGPASFDDDVSVSGDMTVGGSLTVTGATVFDGTLQGGGVVLSENDVTYNGTHSLIALENTVGGKMDADVLANVWNQGTSYQKGAFVLHSSDYYESLTNDNIGHFPYSSPTYWKKMKPLLQKVTEEYVPTVRTVNGKPLSANVQLTANDIGISDFTTTTAVEKISSNQITNSVLAGYLCTVAAAQDMADEALTKFVNFTNGVNVVMGKNASCARRAEGSIAIGWNAASESSDTSIGSAATASGGDSISIGSEATADGGNSVSIGAYSYAYNDNSVVIGVNATSHGEGTVTLGKNATTADKIYIGSQSLLAYLSSLAWHPASATLSGYGITDAYTKTQINGTTVTNLGAVVAATNAAKAYADSATNALKAVAHSGSYTDLSNKPTAADIGAATPEYVDNANSNTLSIVQTWENFLDGSNVVFSITNYISGTYNLDAAKLRIMEMTNGVYREVYNSRDEILLHIDDFKNTDFRVATNQVIQGVSAAIADKADKAWGKYTSAGGEAPSNTVYMTAPNTVFAGGMEYERVAVGEGSVCILTTKGAPVYTQGDEGTFKFQDDGGTNYFGFAKTDSYVIGANASGISVQNHIVTINYDVTMSGVPCIWYKQAIESDVEWEQLNLPDGTPVAGASHVVSWEATPPAGRETCYINCPEAKGFFKATIEVPGSAKFMTNMPADFSGGILCTDGEHKVKINWNNGAPTLVPAN